MSNLELFIFQLILFGFVGLLLEKYWSGFSWTFFSIGFFGVTLIKLLGS